MPDIHHTQNIPSTDTILGYYRTIRLIRRFGEVGMDLYREGLIHGYFHSYIGQEAIATGACAALRSDDYIVSNHRGHGHCIAKGADINRMMAELFGREDGYSHGRGGSMHMADHESGNIGTSGIVGAGIPIAAGVAMGIKREGSDRVVVCFFGDGAANNGVFGETLNLAAIYKLPVIFLLENNCYAATTPASETAACERFADRAAGFGLPGVTVYGNDPETVAKAVAEAVERARRGDGPTLIEAETYRQFGHHINDSGAYMPPNEVALWKERDPVALIRARALKTGVSEDTLNAADDEIERQVADAAEFARNSSEPSVQDFMTSVSTYDK